MTFRKLVGLAAIGGLLYAHKRRGGQFTLASFNQTFRELMEGAKKRAHEAERRLHERVSEATKPSEDVGYGSRGYGYGGGSDFGR